MQPVINKISAFHRTLLYISGTSVYAMRYCARQELYFFTGIGLQILCTGILAFLSMSYCANFIYQSDYLHNIIGFIWALIIINIDRTLVISHYKSKYAEAGFLKLMLRFLLAFMISFMISKPIELFVFRNEINQEISDKDINFNFISSHQQVLTKKCDDLEKQIKEKQRLKNAFYDRIKSRPDNITSRRDGSRSYRRIQGSIDDEYRIKALENDETALQSKLSKIQILLSAQKGIDSIKTVNINETKKLRIDDFVVKLDALNELHKKSTNYYGSISFFIMFIIMLIETLPLLIRVFSGQMQYDSFLVEEEDVLTSFHRRHIYNTVNKE